MRQIGKGAFTTAYLKSKNTVLLKSSDPVKECMAHGWFPKSHNFPKVSFYKHTNDYVMKYYPKKKSLKKSLKPSEWQFYKELQKLFNSVQYHYGYNIAFLIRQIKIHISKPHKRRILLEAIDALRNYGEDIRFEISPRNVAVSPTGNLVLLDVFFFAHKLRESRL